MSNPESLTVSLEWAMKLKEAGYPQVTPFVHWIEYRDDPKNMPDNITHFLYGSKRDGTCGVAMNGHTHIACYAAPSSEEILRTLPGGRCIEATMLITGEWEISWIDRMNDRGLDKTLKSDTLSNAAAAMFCYLADNKLLATLHSDNRLMKESLSVIGHAPEINKEKGLPVDEMAQDMANEANRVLSSLSL